jgi:hypothetical protein
VEIGGNRRKSAEKLASLVKWLPEFQPVSLTRVQGHFFGYKQLIGEF